MSFDYGFDEERTASWFAAGEDEEEIVGLQIKELTPTTADINRRQNRAFTILVPLVIIGIVIGAWFLVRAGKQATDEAPQAPATEQPAPEQPAPEQPAPEQTAPTDEQPEQPAQPDEAAAPAQDGEAADGAEAAEGTPDAEAAEGTEDAEATEGQPTGE